MKQTLRKIVLGTVLAGTLFNGGCKEDKPTELRPQLLYPDLQGFKDDPIAKASGLVSVMYDFGSDSIVTLKDLTRDGKIDHMTVESCVPYRGQTRSHIYMSREVSPNAQQDEYFRLVEQSFFEPFNTALVIPSTK